jgi:TetR/AcrR family transcriptional repressor of nem operon
MARPREFDPDTVLEQALQVFWARGYEMTSLDDLCQATKLNRSSLYATFGDKHALFLKTIDRYADGAVVRISTALAKPIPIKEAIAGFLEEIIDRIVSGPGRIGCFIGNCAAEMVHHDHAAATSVRRHLDRIEATFRSGFAQAKARGELSSDTDIDALARFIVSSTQGLRLIGKTTSDRDALEGIARVMLRCLN